MSLGQKALGGFVWTLASNLGLKAVTLVVGIVLARLLTPEDFGLVAMLMVFFAVSQSLVNSGFTQALIREDKLTEKDKATAFSLNVLIAVVCYAILWWSAPVIADFFDNQLLIDLTRLMGLSIIFQSFTLVQQAQLTHGLKFKKLMIVSLLASLITGVIGVVLALQGYGVWALAIKYVALSVFTSLLFYIINPWFPKYFISKDSFKRLFGFGSKLFASGLLDTFYQNIYKLIIGKFFMASTLGLFTQARMFVDQVTLSATSTLQTVTYPILSKTKNDPERLKRAYQKIIMASSFVIFPLTMGLAVLAKPFILTLVGEKWIDAVPFMQILCFSGALYHLHSINLNVLKVMGRSDLFLKLEIIKKVNITIAVIIGIQFGIWGLLLGSVISSYIALFINMHYTQRFINYSYKEQFKDLLPIVFQSLPMLIGVAAFVYLTDLANGLTLIIGALLAIFLYLIVTYSIKSQALIYIVELLSEKFPKLKKLKL